LVAQSISSPLANTVVEIGYARTQSIAAAANGTDVTTADIKQ